MYVFIRMDKSEGFDYIASMISYHTRSIYNVGPHNYTHGNNSHGLYHDLHLQMQHHHQHIGTSLSPPFAANVTPIKASVFLSQLSHLFTTY